MVRTKIMAECSTEMYLTGQNNGLKVANEFKYVE